MISWMMMMMMKMVMVENIMPCPNDHSTRFSHSQKDTQVIMLIRMIMMMTKGMEHIRYLTDVGVDVGI